MTKKIIFIFGCQRSGTSATTQGLKNIEGFKVFDETNDIIHKKSSDTFRLRLKSVKKLKTIFKMQQEPIIVVKPLVESQNTLKILDSFENSIALWFYRDYFSVANSILTTWGAEVGKSMLYMIAKGENENWRSENFGVDTCLFARSILD